MKVRRGGSQDTTVGFEHMSLDVDGEVAEPAVFSLSVQTIQHRRLSAGEAHLQHWAWCVAGAWAAAAPHLHGQGLHLGGRKALTTHSADSIMASWLINFKFLQGVTLKHVSS